MKTVDVTALTLIWKNSYYTEGLYPKFGLTMQIPE